MDGRRIASDPVLTYGRHKAEIEEYLSAQSLPSLIVRLPKVVAAERGSTELLGTWMNQLESDVAIRCADDQIFSPVAIDDVVSGLTSC